MICAAQEHAARKRYREMAPVLNEQSRRRFVALEAQALGRGGICLMSEISGLARPTIYRGLSDICDNVSAPPGQIRKEGGGRRGRQLRIQPCWSPSRAWLRQSLEATRCGPCCGQAEACATW